MSRLRLSFACAPYDFVRPILDGDVRVEGVDLTGVRVAPAAELFWRQLRHEEFDIAELSLSNYLMETARGVDRFIAIPVFPHREFRHSALWTRTDSDITRPEDLAGKRVGIPEYSMTMMLFVRGLLEHDHGVRPADITWVRVRPERATYEAPDVRVEEAPPGASLDDLLLDGLIDAAVTTRVPPASRGDAPRLRRVIPHVRAVEEDYYRRTGIFPIMHVLVLKRAVYEANRWLAPNLLDAFGRAKEMAYENLLSSQPSCTLPWLADEIETTWSVFGGDPYPLGVLRNVRTLDAAAEWSYGQGLSPRRVQVEELFAPEAVGAFQFHAQR
jgi:4,5-dihydroxyphthalate decarboxylase